MKRIWIPLCLILGFAMLAYSLYFWGGIASTEEVGALVRERASTFSFITWAYITSGQGIIDLLGWQDTAGQHAIDQVGFLFAEMKATPYSAMDHLFREMPGLAKTCYYGGPMLILIGTFAHLRKPKTFKTFG